MKSNDIVCNVNGAKVPSGVETIAANAGDTIKVQWDQSTHPGPITHMLYGPVDDASMATGIGAGWFKIDEQNFVGGKVSKHLPMRSSSIQPLGSTTIMAPIGLPVPLSDRERSIQDRPSRSTIFVCGIF